MPSSHRISLHCLETRIQCGSERRLQEWWHCWQQELWQQSAWSQACCKGNQCVVCASSRVVDGVELFETVCTAFGMLCFLGSALRCAFQAFTSAIRLDLAFAFVQTTVVALVLVMHAAMPSGFKGHSVQLGEGTCMNTCDMQQIQQYRSRVPAAVVVCVRSPNSRPQLHLQEQESDHLETTDAATAWQPTLGMSAEAIAVLEWPQAAETSMHCQYCTGI